MQYVENETHYLQLKLSSEYRELGYCSENAISCQLVIKFKALEANFYSR